MATNSGTCSTMWSMRRGAPFTVMLLLPGCAAWCRLAFPLSQAPAGIPETIRAGTGNIEGCAILTALSNTPSIRAQPAKEGS